MSSHEYDFLDEEVKELLQNYKNKKATIYEPCTLKNYKECLISLSEEFGLLNIKYVFNPYVDFDSESIRLEALVNFINSVWTLFHFYKTKAAKSEELAVQNHTLEHNNKQLNGLVEKLKTKLNCEKNEAKACVASVQRISDNSDEMSQKLTEARLKIAQLTKQKAASEKSLKTEISRLKTENDKLYDRIKSKSSPCSQGCDMTVQQLKERDRHHRAVIAQLQKSNQDLLREVLNMKEEFILAGLNDFNLDKQKK